MPRILTIAALLPYDMIYQAANGSAHGWPVMLAQLQLTSCRQMPAQSTYACAAQALRPLGHCQVHYHSSDAAHSSLLSRGRPQQDTAATMSQQSPTQMQGPAGLNFTKTSAISHQHTLPRHCTGSLWFQALSCCMPGWQLSPRNNSSMIILPTACHHGMRHAEAQQPPNCDSGA
jgi:hypothetical protein